MYKYQPQIDDIISKGFPMPEICDIAKPIECYRFVYKDDSNKSFLPQYMKNPRRMVSDIDKQNATVMGYALSMFDTEENAKSFYCYLLSNCKRIKSAIGDSLSKLQLTANDGSIDNKNDIGHFNLLEYDTCNLVEQFNVIEIL